MKVGALDYNAEWGGGGVKCVGSSLRTPVPLQ